jgi:hypothetical protein
VNKEDTDESLECVAVYPVSDRCDHWLWWWQLDRFVINLGIN